MAAIWVTRPDQVFDELGKLTVEWAEPARALLEAPWVFALDYDGYRLQELLERIYLHEYLPYRRKAAA